MDAEKIAEIVLDGYCDHTCCCDCPFFDEINYNSKAESCLDWFMQKVNGEKDDTKRD